MLGLELAQTGFEFRDLGLKELRAAGALLFVVLAFGRSAGLRTLPAHRTRAITFLSGVCQQSLAGGLGRDQPSCVCGSTGRPCRAAGQKGPSSCL